MFLKLKKNEIKIVLKKGKILKTNNFKIKYIKNKNIKINIIVFKKKIKKSVKRNKIKRIIYNSFIINKYILNNNSYFIIFIYLNNKVLKFKIINNEIINIFKKLIILNNK
ncbi:MAG: ribonuclease P protein component [Candidatus Shikimatogenerans bostrichidophilus]|nr:MAG: ribonuclease P protein component [Candidatus Shikimatogenerans bostrichidophilus]